MEDYREKYLQKEDALNPLPTPFETLATRFNSRLLLGRTRSGDRILDIGCNKGYLLAALCGRRAYGLDLHFGYRVPGPRYVAGDASHLPFHGGHFDAVAMAEVIEHLPDRLPPYREIRRVLRPGGLLLLTHPNKQNPLQRALEWVKENRWVRRALGRRLYAGFQHIGEYSLRDTTSCLKEMGFTLVEVHTPSLGLLRLSSPFVYGRFRCEGLFPLLAAIGMCEEKLSLKLGRLCSLLPSGYTMLFSKS